MTKLKLKKVGDQWIPQRQTTPVELAEDIANYIEKKYSRF